MKDATLITDENRKPDLFQGMKPGEIIDNLDNLAHAVTEESYMRPLSDEELSERREKHVEQSIKLQKLANEKARVTKNLNAEIKVLGLSNKEVLNDLTFGAVSEEGRVFAVLSDDAKTVDLYNEAGKWLRSRKPTANERQTHINMKIAQ